MDFKTSIAQEIATKVPASADVILTLIEIPPDVSLGDFALPCFSFAKELKKSPHQIAVDLATRIAIPEVRVEVKGPYLNFFVDSTRFSASILRSIFEKDAEYGKSISKAVVLVESPGPNTNKPLHLGHLRNILLGDSISRILSWNGKTVHIVNVVNDRGVHICKSMLAYQKFGNNTTPESVNLKSDHFVGKWYVEYSKYEKEHPEVEQEVQEMLVKWENGDSDTIALWKKMNDWALGGFSETYKKLDFTIEKEYYESETYSHGKDVVVKGFESGIFSKDDEGAIIIDLEAKGLGKKVLLRSNGTSVYVTQDIYMAKKRYEDFSFDEMVYVVGNEQEYHFKVLFEVFKFLGWSFGEQCSHFSYGLVNLPDGRMKSREGTVVDTDNLLEEVFAIAKEEVSARYDSLEAAEIDARAKFISEGAIRFFILKHDPKKNFVYNPKESISFEGETGPYVQYTHARICSILRKANIKQGAFSEELLSTPLDKELVKLLANFSEVVADAGKKLAPNLLCNYLIKLSQTFNSYYSQNKIIQEDFELQNARLHMISAVKIVISIGLYLLHIHAPEEM
jgi:arginyl-tRNA synthetase